MRDARSIATLAKEQHIPPCQLPPQLPEPLAPDFMGPNDRDDAQRYMLHLRHDINGRKQPSKSFRAKIKLRNQSDIERINTTFTLQERRDAFHHYLKNRKSVGTAQAILDFHPSQSIDINVRHENASKPRAEHAGDDLAAKESRWLEMATEGGQEDYVRLLAARYPTQRSLDRCLKLAIEHNSLETAKVLLTYGADPDSCQEEFQRLSLKGDVGWTTVLLSSSKFDISQEGKDKALLVVVGDSNFDMAHLLLSAGADATCASGECILSAVSLTDFRMLTLLVSTAAEVDTGTFGSAMEYASNYDNIDTTHRVHILNLLLLAGAMVPFPSRKDLLRAAVEANDTALVSLLSKHKQVANEEATLGLGYIAKSTTDENVAVIMGRLLFAVGADAFDSGGLLQWAVEKDFRRMVALLIHQGVSIDFDNSVAVRRALDRQDIPLLKLILHGESPGSGKSRSTATVLASVLPETLNLPTQRMRHEALSLLIDKGIEGDHVDRALLDLVLSPAICDVDIARILLEAGASVNLQDKDDNCIYSSARDGNMPMVNLLIAPDWEATPEILSKTVLTLFRNRTKCSLDDLKSSLIALLQRECVRDKDEVSQALLLAIRGADDAECADIADVFLNQGANVNFQNGRIVLDALALADEGLFLAICKNKTISQKTFTLIVHTIIGLSRLDQVRLSTFLHACRTFKESMSNVLIEEIVNGPSGGQKEIIDLLLNNGADVNHNSGIVFNRIINNPLPIKSLRDLRLLLGRHPNDDALWTAFESARKVQCSLDHRHKLYKSILVAGHRGENRHGALNDTVQNNKDDLTIPRLLLEYGASIEQGGGVALGWATRNANLTLMYIMTTHHLSKETVEKAFHCSCSMDIAEPHRFKLFECLLETKKVSPGSTTQALTQSITRGSVEERMLSLLIRHRALIEDDTIVHLVREQDVITTRFLLELQIPRQQARSKAVQASRNLDQPTRLAFAKLLVIHGIDHTTWTIVLHEATKNQETELLQLLLQHPSGQEKEIEKATASATILAAKTLNPVILQALLVRKPNSTTRNRAFAEMLDSGMMRSTASSVEAAIALLESDIEQTLKDRALLQSLTHYQQEQCDFFKVLIKHGADVKANSHLGFIIAGQFETLDIFNALLRSGPDFDLLIESLVTRIPQDRYERLLQLVFIVLECELYTTHRRAVKVIMQSMHRFGRGNGLLRLLINHNYPPGETIKSADDDTMRTEAVTPLIWALGQPSPGVSDAVILELLEEGKRANPGFSTPDSGTTAVNMAAQNGRHDILERLIALKVDLSIADAFGRTPLFYAAANADAMSVYLLLENGAQVNDGSLQEAARLCQGGMVAMLLQHGHDAEFPSDLHEGRTALGELCSKANLQGGEQSSAGYETMKLLIGSNTDLSFKVNGRTILHLAFENKSPIEVTRALLRFPEVYKDIQTDSEVFLYEDSQKRLLSPDVYVKQHCKHNDHGKKLLVTLLEQKSCKEKWFTKRGQQLADCKGLPPALEAEMARQNLADQAEQRENQRRQQKANMEHEIAQKQHDTNMRHGKERADLQLYNKQRQNDQEVAHDSRLAIQRRENANVERADERNHIRESERIQHEGAQNRAELVYSSQQQLKQLEFNEQHRINESRYAAAKRYADLERKTRESTEAAEISSQRRIMARLERQDQSVQLAAREQRALIMAAKEARVKQERLAIQYDELD